jgi:hypothetical protein
MAFVRAGAGRRRVRTLVLAAAILAASAVPAAAVSSGKYRGKTSQGRKASMTVSGNEIQRFTIFWNAACQNGHYLNDAETYNTHVRISHNAWSVAGSYMAPAPGYNEYFKVKDHGTFGAKHTVSGAFSGTVRVYTAGKGKTQPKFVTSCKSGTITFRLHRVA